MTEIKIDMQPHKNLNHSLMQATPWLEHDDTEMVKKNQIFLNHKYFKPINFCYVALFVAASFLLADKISNNTTHDLGQKIGLIGGALSDPFSRSDASAEVTDSETLKAKPSPEDQILSRYVGGMNSKQLAEKFESLVKLAQAGDAKLAFELSQRLRDCTSSSLQMNPNTKTRREKTYTELSLQELCSNLTGAQLTMAGDLANIAAAAKHPQAMLNNILDGLDAIDAKAKLYKDQNPGATTLPDNSKEQGEYIKQLTSLAESGNIKALAELADIYVKAELVAPDYIKQFTYKLVVEADWQIDSSQFTKSPILEETAPPFKAKLLQETNRFYDSCCFNKKKFSSGVDL